MRSLQARFIAMSLTILLLSGLVAGLGAYQTAKIEADEIVDTQLAQIIQTLLFIGQTDELDAVGDIGLPPRLHHGQTVFQVWRLKPAHPPPGSIAWSRQALPDDRERPYPRLMLRSGGIDWGRADVAEDGYRTLVLADKAFRFLAATSADGEIRAVAGQDLVDREEMVRLIAWNNTWPYLLALPLGGIALVWSIRRNLAPLRHLTSDLENRDPTHLQHLRVADAPLELRPLLNALNTLLDRLNLAMDSERRFTGDAAHELRTPMAALRAQLDALRLANNKETRMQAQQQATASLERMSRLIGQLLTLARLDCANPDDVRQLEAAPLVEEICGELAPRAVTKDIDLSLRAEPVKLRCEEDALRILLRNLLDNALRYCPRGSRIEVQLGATAERTQLAVADNGPGVAAARRQELGQRFHRLDRTDTEGVGLGLSIVLRIAERYGAAVSFGEGLDGRGLTVALDFQTGAPQRVSAPATLAHTSGPDAA